MYLKTSWQVHNILANTYYLANSQIKTTSEKPSMRETRFSKSVNQERCNSRGGIYIHLTETISFPVTALKVKQCKR